MVSLLLIIFAFSFTTQQAYSQNIAIVANEVSSAASPASETNNGTNVEGNVITYEVTIMNTGTIDLNSVVTKLNGTDITSTPTSYGDGDAILNVGETWVYTTTYTITAADITNTYFDNVFTSKADETVSVATFETYDASATMPITDSNKIHEDDFATATIKVLPMLTIGSLLVTEGTDANAVLPVSISHPSNEPVIVDVIIGIPSDTAQYGSAPAAGGTADYSETIIQVTIAANATSTIVTIPILNDNVGESTESFTVNGTSSSTCPATPATVTILDEDTPVVILDDVTVTEGTDTFATIPVSISNPSDEIVVVEITQTTGTAGTADYTVTTIEVTFNPGETSTTVDIEIEDDLLLENTETFNVNGTVTSGNATNATPSIVTILDNDINAIVIGSVIVTEGTDAVATVPVSITNPSVFPTIISLTYDNGSTEGAADYVATTVTVTIPAGQTTTNVNIQIVDDSTHEPTETFTLSGTSPTATSGAPGSVTINDDDAVPTLTIGNDTVTEGDAISIPVTLSNPSSENTVVTITYDNGTTQGASDYVATTVSVTINAGDTQVLIPISTQEDTTNEPTESFTINGSVTSGNTSNTTASGIGTINDDDAVPTIELGDVTVTEGTDPTAEIPVTLSNPSSEPVDVTVTLTAGTAGEEDYVETVLTVTISAGDTQGVVNLGIVDDNIDEATESLTAVGTADNATTSSPATVTILDDPTDTPTIELGDVTVTEGTDPTAEIPVTLSNPSDEDVEVTVTLTAGTAGEEDYVETVLTVTISAGDTQGVVNLGIVDDNIDEATESLTAVGTADNATTSSPATVTILDDPTDTPTIELGDVTVTEGTDPTAEIPVTLSNPSDEDVDVTVTLTAGTAGEEDYVETVLTVTISAGDTQGVVNLGIVDDNIDEATESLTAVGTADNATTSSPATVTILDDPTDTPTIELGDVTVTEGTDPTAEIPVTLSNPSDEDVDVTVTLTAGTAGEEDYVETVLTVTISAGDTQGVVNLGIVDDNIDEATESLTAVGTADNATTSSPATVTILDDPTDTPTIELGDVTVTEGTDPTAEIPVTLSNPSDEDVDVTVTLTAGTAGEEDYVETVLTVTISAGDTQGVVNLGIVDDNIDEATESLTAVGTADNATTSSPATVTILDDPTDTPTIELGDVTVTEGTDPTAEIPVTLSNPSDEDVDVTVTLTAGTAGEEDYVETVLTVTISAGDTQGVVNLGIVDDNIDEATESLTAVGTADNATTSSPATVTILDDPTDTPVIELGDVTVTEGTDPTAEIPVTLSNPSDEDVDVTVTLTAGTAGEEDYVETVLTVTISAGDTQGVVNLGIVDDNIDEATESLTAVGTADNATTSSPATVTILDDPTDTPVIELGDVTVTEGTDPTAEIPVTLSNPSDEDVEVTVTLTAGTAGEEDYVETVLTVTISAGDTQGVVNLGIVDDNIDEATESLTAVGTADNATTSSPATVTILDDPTDTPTIELGDVTVTEGTDPTAEIPVTLSNPSDEDVDVTVTLTAGTAGEEDYVETVLTVTISAGDTQGVVNLGIVDDNIDEATESLTAVGTADNATTSSPATVTILDDPTDTPTIELGDVTVTEGTDPTAEIPVTLSNPSDEDVEVTVTLTAGTAGEEDYVETVLTVTISAGDTQGVVNLGIVDDNIDEATESLTAVGTADNATTSSPATVTILDDPTDTPTIELGDVTVTEGTDPTAEIPVTLSNPSDEDVDVTVTLTAGTAGEEDYVETVLTVTISAGDTQGVVNLGIVDDNIDEATESLTAVGTADNATTSSPATVTILDDPTDTPTIELGDVTVTEGTDPTAEIPVTLSNPSDEDVDVTVTLTAGTAGEEDYVETVLTVTISAGDTQGVVNLGIVDDNIDEATESLTAVGTADNATTSSPATVTILDDPTDTPTIELGDVTVTEGTDPTAEIPVTLSNPSDEDVDVTVTLTAGTAGEEDYVETVLTVTISAGDTQGVVNLGIVDDNIDEATESLTAVGTADNATTSSPATVTILDDPTDTPTIELGDVTVTEGTDPTAEIPVTLSNPSDEDVDVTVTLTAGTAGEEDYVETVLTVTISAGDTQGVVNLGIVDDNIDEATESLTAVGTADNATTSSPATVTILDDPTDTPTIELGDVTVTEGTDPTAEIPVTLSNPSDEDVEVTVTLTAGTAGEEDYVETVLTVTISAGDTQGVVNLGIVDDNIDEATESLTAVGTADNATTSSPATVTILDDPTDTPTIELGDVTVTEGTDPTAEIPVTLSNPSDEDVDVTVTLTAGTAGEEDYVETVLTVTISAGDTQGVVNLGIVDDNIDEATESLTAVGTADNATTSSPATVTILDDPTDTPTIELGDVTVTEGTDPTAEIPVTLSNPSDEDVDVTVTLTAGTAGEEDYVETVLTVTISAGDTQGVVNLGIVDDNIDEATESLTAVGTADNATTSSPATVTILDDPTDTPTIELGDVTVTEGTDPTAEIPVTLSNPSDEDVDVTVTLTAGTAGEEDYVETVLTVTISAGDTQGVVNLGIVDDNIDEATESLTAVGTADNATTSSPATVTILDDPTDTPTIELGDVTVTEGTDPTAEIPVTLSNPSDEDVDVTVTLTAGTAGEEDYVETVLTVTISAGDTQGVVNLGIVDDNIDEATESLTAVGTADNATTSSPATVTILDDPTDTPVIELGDVTVTEGTDPTAEIPVTLSNPSDEDVDVTVTLTAGTAGEEDYVETVLTVTISAGDTQGVVNLGIVDDNIDEATESLTAVGTADNATTSSPATVTILDDPTDTPVIELGDVTVTEGTDPTAEIPVTLSNPSDEDVEVTVTLTAGTAGEEDYVETVLTVTISAGDTQGVVNLGIVDDNIDEATESLTAVGTADNATTSSPATVTILDDPTDTPTIELGDVTVTEGTDPTAEIPVTLSNPSDEDVDVTVTLTAGTAGEEDYVETVLTVTISAGDTQGVVNLGIVDDNIDEATESLTAVGTADNATTSSPATVTILDDPTDTPTIELGDVTVTEGTDPTAEIPVTLSNPSDEDVEVTVTLTAGTAGEEDYVETVLTVTISAGDTQGVVNLGIVDDNIDEATESLTAVGTADNATTSSPATVTILDDPTDTPVIELGDVTVTEGTDPTAEIPVTLSNPSDEDVEVTVTLTAGTAGEEDYVETVLTVTISAGDTQGVVNLGIVDDNIDEATESLTAVGTADNATTSSPATVTILDDPTDTPTIELGDVTVTEGTDPTAEIPVTLSNPSDEDVEVTVTLTAGTAGEEDYVETVLTVTISAGDTQGVVNLGIVDDNIDEATESLTAVGTADNATTSSPATVTILDDPTDTPTIELGDVTVTEGTDPTAEIPVTLSNPSDEDVDVTVTLTAGTAGEEDYVETVLTVTISAGDTQGVVNLGIVDDNIDEATESLTAVGTADNATTSSPATVTILDDPTDTPTIELGDVTVTEGTDPTAEIPVTLSNPSDEDVDVTVTLTAGTAGEEDYVETVLTVTISAGDTQGVVNLGIVDDNIDEATESLTAVGTADNATTSSPATVTILDDPTDTPTIELGDVTVTEGTDPTAEIPVTLSNPSDEDVDVTVTLTAGTAGEEDYVETVLTVTISAGDTQGVVNLGIVDDNIDEATESLTAVGTADNATTSSPATVTILDDPTDTPTIELGDVTVTEGTDPTAEIPVTLSNPSDEDVDVTVTLTAGTAGEEDYVETVLTVTISAGDTQGVVNLGIVDDNIDEATESLTAVGTADNATTSSPATVTILDDPTDTPTIELGDVTVTEGTDPTAEIPVTLSNPSDEDVDVTVTLTAGTAGEEDYVETVLTVTISAGDTQGVVNLGIVDDNIDEATESLTAVGTADNATTSSPATVTILDDPTDTPTIELGDVTVTEGTDPTAEIPVTLSNPSDEDVDVTVTLTAGTAGEEDYVETVLTVTISAGDTQGVVNLGIVDDNIDEATESLTAVGTADNATTSSPATVTILDDPTDTPTIELGDVTVTEGTDPTAEIPVTLSNPSDEDVDVTVTLTAGTAGEEDYVETVLTVTISAGDTQGVVNLGIVDDNIDEATESLTAVGTADNATTSSPATVTILDDPTDTPTIELGDVTVTEGTDPTAEIPVTLSNPSDEDVDVTVTLTAGTAGEEDYVETVLTVTISAGDTQGVVNLGIVDDNIDEATESLTAVGTADNATTSSPATVTILDDPTDTPTIELGDVTVTEGTDPTAEIPVTLSNPSDEDVDVTVTLTAGTAGEEDYVETVLTVTISAGDTQGVVNLGIVDDNIDEATESLTAVGTADNATTSSPATVTILDDPTDTPVIELGDVTVTEGTDPTAEIPVTLSNPSDEDVEVTVTLTAGTAGEEDYVETVLTVTISAGDTQGVVNLGIVDDNIDEATESLTAVGTADNATTSSPATVTILDDPTDTPVIELGDVTVTEGTDPTAEIPVTLSNPSDEDVDVTVTLTAGTAGEEDYVETVLTVTISAGDTQGVVNLGIVDDNIDEATESLTAVGTADNATTSSPATVTILDDPTDTPTIELGDVTVTEGTDPTAEIPVTLSNPSDEDVDVTVTLTAGTAGEEDYVETVLTVTISAGDTQGVVNLGIVDDNIDEATESLTAVGTADNATTSSPATVTILDDPTDTPTIELGDVTVTEGTDPTAEIPVTLSNPSDEDVDVTVTLTAGTAGEEDYVETVLTVTISAGDTQGVVNLGIVDDNIDEATESLTAVGTADNATTSSPATVTILDDPTDTPTIELGDVTVTEGTDPTAEIPVTLSNPSDEDVDVTVTLTAGTAGEEDYVETVLTVTISAGDTQGVVNLGIVDDNIDEATESLTAVGTADNATTSSPATVTILDDPTDTPMIELGDVTVTEGTDPTAEIPVTLSNPSSEPVDVTVTLTAGTAGEEDYVETVLTVTISAGDTQGVVNLGIVDDNIDEATESLTAVGTADNATTSSPATVTILDDPTDTPTIELGDVTVTEGTDPTAEIPVTLSNPSDEDVDVTVTLTAGTAGEEDYVETVLTVTISAGDTQGVVNLGIVDDNIDEATESLTAVGTADNATTSSPATVTILDDPTDTPTIELGDVTVTEGTDPTAEIPVTLSNPSDEDVDVTVTLTAGTAGEEDYVETVLTVTISAGDTQGVVNLGIVDDNIDEATESLTAVGTADNATTSSPATVTILDDPTDTPTIELGDVTVTEGDDAVIPVTLSNPSDEDVIVEITTSTGTAGTDDYNETTITVVIPAGDTSVDVVIGTIDDGTIEPAETFTVNGEVTSGNTNNETDTSVVTIEDNETTPVVTIGDVIVTEGSDMSVDAVVPVTIDVPSSVDTVIEITQTSGTAGTDDYIETTIVVTIPAGETSVDVTLEVLSDNIDEATESFILNGVVTSGTATEVNNGSVTILDDPTDVPTLELGDVTVTEGEDPVAVIPVTLSNPSDEDVVVEVAVTSGTAGTDDYVETVVSVTIPAGETQGEVVITIIDDNIDEATETFTINGTSDNANPSETGIVTILDDPADVPTVTIGDVTVTEGTDATADVPVTLSNPSDEDVVITITTSTGTAGTDDFVETTVTVTIPAGETMVVVSVPILDDTLNEETETFVVNGEVTSGNTANVDPKGTVTILNNPVEVNLEVVKTVDNLSPMPNGTTEVMFTITLTNHSNFDATNVVINEELQSGFTYVSDVAELGDYDHTTGLWTVGTVPANSTVTLLITVIVNDNASGNLDYSNTVEIQSSDQLDTDVSDNEFTVTLTPICLTVYNVFSPNGDGTNDYFRIDCIENYPGATISIFNRWGNTVYTATDYKNDWDGTSNGRATISAGEKLPTGTYYYVIDLKNGSPVIKSWLQIVH
ncbi:hypothetical protein LPB136_02035 [Tenacibaculum todarodis]|uniref:Calx-beta domain-containing protein n=2 Tax=Tenacibaculum todarodis TaxID=1850252 RepID=A0A1L3JGH0_9FLAO|nr:hypothetical protein LPB136_02035 [Tenacibaculum todarodis]